ncbi:MAG: peptidase [Sphingomonas bacterium]|nr:peptidase [Sphingomonas bacterium]
MFGAGGGAAVLTFDAAPLRPIAKPAVGKNGIAAQLGARLAGFEIVVDLGARIGSGRWWRGLATCLSLCTLAASFAPGFTPIAGIGPAALPESQWQEARALAIAPLAFGADTGRRMGPTDAVEPLTDTPERPSIELAATLGAGDGFARVLERAGVAAGEAADVAGMVRGVLPLGDLNAGTRMDVVLGRRANRMQARPLDRLLFRARFDLKLAIERVGGRLQLQRIPVAVDATPLRIQGRVGDSLFRSARAAGAPASAVQAYIKALSARLSIGGDVRADDRFDLIVANRRAETGEVETGDLLYAGLDQGRRQMRLLRWPSGGKPQWFEASGVGERRGVMRMPVSGRLTSGFGMRRHPLLRFARMHAGMDIAAPRGSPIVAATDGVVDFAGWHGGHGKFVRIAHGGGLGTGYGHMSSIVVRSGTRVRQGQVIGYVGSTGLSTGPHLHYEVYRGGRAVNPSSVSFITTSQLVGADLAAFRATLARLTAVKPGAAQAGPGRAPSAAATAAVLGTVPRS